MLVAELKWLLKELPTENGDRKRIETAYGDEIKEAKSDGKTIDLFSVDKYTLPELAISLGCPAFHADRRVPFPAGALLNMPRPSDAGKRTADGIDGHGFPGHMRTTAPLHDRLTEKYPPGPMFDMAAARTFQQRPEGRGTGLDDHSWVTEAYREDSEQRREAEDLEDERLLRARQAVERVGNTTYPHALQLCTQTQLDRLEQWRRSDEETEIELLHGHMLIKSKAQEMLDKQPKTSRSITKGFVDLLRNYVVDQGHAGRIAVMDPEPIAAVDDCSGWAMRSFQHGVSRVTFDRFDAILVPIVAGRHFSLVIVEINRSSVRVVIYNPDAPTEMGQQRKITEMLLLRRPVLGPWIHRQARLCGRQVRESHCRVDYHAVARRFDESKHGQTGSA